MCFCFSVASAMSCLTKFYGRQNRAKKNQTFLYLVKSELMSFDLIQMMKKPFVGQRLQLANENKNKNKNETPETPQLTNELNSINKRSAHN